MINTVGDLIKELQKHPADAPIVGNCGQNCSHHPMCVGVRKGHVDLKKYEWLNNDAGEENCVVINVDN